MTAKRAKSTPRARPAYQIDLIPMPGTRVVNIKRTPELARDPRYVYIGRRKGVDPRTIPPGTLGSLGNPWDRKQFGDEEAMKQCEAYLRNRCRQELSFRTLVRSLHGKILGCYCVRTDGSGLCHGKLLAAIAKELVDGIFR